MPLEAIGMEMTGGTLISFLLIPAHGYGIEPVEDFLGGEVCSAFG